MQATATKASAQSEQAAPEQTSSQPAGEQSPEQIPLWAEAAGPLLQFSLKVNRPDDEYEAEAERVAEQVVRRAEVEVGQKSNVPGALEDANGVEKGDREALEIQRQASREEGEGNVPSVVDQALEQPGQPLDAAARHFMEDRFDQDFSRVRIHTAPYATAAAQALNARAFTFDQEIFFGEREFAPQTRRGKRLLAHELTHVVQQTTGLRRDPDDGPASGGDESEQSDFVTIAYAVPVDRTMSSSEFLVEVIRQYRGLSEDEARREAANWHWVGEPEPITERDVRRGFRLVGIRDRTQTLQPSTPEERSERARSFRRLPAGAQERINDEADRRFWESTNYRPGQLLGNSPADQAMARTWLRYRDQVTREHLELAALPEEIREAMFDQYATETADPADYPQLLRIARKLQDLTPVQLTEYRNRINSLTDDLDDVEASVDRYIEMLGRREEEATDYRQIETRLYGLQELYHLSKRLESTESTASLPSHDEFGVQDPTVTEARLEVRALREEYQRALAQNGFDSAADFEAAIQAYIRQFAVQARNIAYDMLARLDHELFEQQRRYEATDAAEALHQRIQASQATEEYERAWALRRRASSIGARTTRSNWREVLAEQRPLLREASEAERTSEEEYQSAIGPDQLAGSLDYRQRVQLLQAGDANTVRTVLLDYIANKREAVRETRANLADDIDLVFELDNLLAAAYQELEISPGSFYDELIRDHIADVSIAEAIWSVAKGIIALALAIVGGAVGGPIGAGAALVAFGIGVEEAVSQFREWEIRSEAHEAGLLSEDPSFAWVIVAVVAAGLDLAGAVAAVRAMRPAVEAFNVSGDVAALERALADLAEVDARVQANVVRAARMEARYQAAVRNLLATSGRLNVHVVPGAEEFARLVQIAYYGARRGIIRFERFLLELRAQNLIDDVESLTGAPLQRYKEAFEQGIEAAGETGTYSTRIQWGIHSIEARPHGPGFWGRRVPQANPRVEAYELKINPANESYYLPHPDGGYVQFEDLAVSVLQDGKLVMSQRSIYHVADMPPFARRQVLAEARRQVAAAEEAGFTVEWLVSEQRALTQMEELFAAENIPITLRLYPE